MNNTINLFGEVGWEVTLQDVMNQVKSTDQNEPLIVNIHSQGGSVFEGLAIYNYLKSLNREVTTVGHGLVASIASVIFLAGTKRVINESTRFLIHLPMGGADGNAEDLEKMAKELRKIEDELSDIYANETSLTKEEAIEQMKLDDFYQNDLLESKGFITELRQAKAVAIFNTNFNNKQMQEEQKEIKGLFAEIKSMVAKLVNPIVNKVVQDANGMSLDFPEVAEDAEPQVGDSASVDGAPAEGEYVMPSGQIYVFESGVLTEIKDGEDEGEDDAEAEAKARRIEELENELNELKNTHEEEIKNLKESNKTSINALNSKIEEIGKAIGGEFEYKNEIKKPTIENKEVGYRKLFKEEK